MRHAPRSRPSSPVTGTRTDGQSSGAMSVKDEFDQDVEVVAAIDDEHTWPKCCDGCLRVVGVDRHYLFEGTDVNWPYEDYRGEFCKDCTNLYRLEYKPSMTSGLFQRWLKSNRILFLGMLLAYLSLKMEGNSHVTKTALKSRYDMLQKLFGLAGVPFPLAAVVMVKEGMEAPRQFACMPVLASASSTTPSDVAILVPRPMPKDVDTEIKTRLVPVADRSLGPWPLLPLSGAPDGFISWWNSLGSSVVPEMMAASAPLAGEEARDAASDTKKDDALVILEKGFEGHLATVKLLIIDFNKEVTNRTKEKDFTGPLTKILKFKQEVLESPYSKTALVPQIEELIASTSACKKIIRPFRDYQRHTSAKALTTMAPFLAVVCEQLVKWAETLGPYLGSFMVRSDFQVWSSNDPISALDAFSEEKLQYDLGGVNISSLMPGNVIVDCISLFFLNKLRDAMEVPTEESQQSSEHELAIFRALRNVVIAYLRFIVEAVRANKLISSCFSTAFPY